MKQRDNEIGILLNYLNKKKEQGSGVPDVKVQRETAQNFISSSEDPNSTQESIARQEEAKQGNTLF